MQKASEIFPLAEREGAIDIISLFVFAYVIALCFKSYFAVEVRKM